MTYFCGKDNGTRMALSKNKIKFIHSLELKKNRKAEKAFLAEGHKLVGDLLGHFHCRLLVATDNGRAFSLYRREGFRAAAVKSRWFQMIGTA